MTFYKKIFLFLLGAFLLISFLGFQKDSTKEEQIQALIDEKVAEKVDKFRKRLLKNCRDRILERAGELADSTIVATAIYTTIIDTTSRPVPPERPERPAIKTPIDTTPVKPFFSIDTTQ